ncbi:MAG: hypothetical protein PGN34_19575 [Methylobacterium frigidaeris]
MTTPPHHHPLLALTLPVALLGSAVLLCAWGLTHETVAGEEPVAEVQAP